MPESGVQTSAAIRRPSGRGTLRSERSIELIVSWPELDFAVAADLERDIALACAREPERVGLDLERMGLDLSRVEFMDCSGLHALERARDRLRRRGKRLTLRALGPQPRRLLELVGMTDAFDFSCR